MLGWKIKICGITNPTDALAAAEFGADAVGLNFYARSLRSVSTERAADIVKEIPSGVCRIGVFVNDLPKNINRLVRQLDLNAVQLHGDETADIASEICCDVIRAVRVFSQDFDGVAESVQHWAEAGVVGILLDSGSRREYGGSGLRLDWEQVVGLNVATPIVLAGGLNCDNVAQAIELAKPAAVDVASGIESFPGKKDRARMKRFIEAAENAFSAL